MKHHLIFLTLFGSLVLFSAGARAQLFKLPTLPSKPQYGNILINRVSETQGQKSVTFSHWSHRQQDTCRVCHFELLFEMKVNTTEITEEKNKQGEFCGACHNGIKAFGHTQENCIKCHNGNIGYGEEKFKELDNFPKARFGNGIDWSTALKEGVIKPRQSILDEGYSPMPFDKRLTLEAKWTMIPSATFPHDEHKQWLDCSNCHPDIFNIKKRATKHFEMQYILDGKFCGVCHLSVAFPLNDCRRCHPDMKE